MSKNHVLPYLAVVAAGALVGWGGSHLRHHGGKPAAAAADSPPGSNAGAVQSMPVQSRPLPAEAADPLSPEYYAQMSIWATDASAADIERIWSERSGAENFVFGAPSLTDMLLARWVELDPEGAVRTLGISNLGSGPAWTAWAKLDPEKALAAAKASERRRSVEWVIKGIAEVDPEKALKMVEEDPTLAPFVIGSITQQYAKEGKFREAVSLKFHYGSYVVREELQQWAKEDPHAAMRWCLDHPFSHPLNRQAVYETFLKEYPDQAHELMAILPDTATRLEFGRKRVSQLVEKDPQQALTFVRAQQDLQTRQTLSIELAGKLTTTDWDTAASLYRDYAAAGGQVSMRHICIYVDERNHTGATNMDPTMDLLRNLTLQRPAETMQLTSAVPNEKERHDVQKSVAQHWMWKDRFGFSEFLAAQPTSPQKDQFTQLLTVNLTFHDDPKMNDFPSSMEWAFSIDNADVRTKAVSHAISEWKEKDPSGFHAYLNDERLPQATKATIQSLLKDSHE